MPTSAHRPLLVLGLFAACMALVLRVTAAGSGITSDSTVYLAAARSLLGGRGLVVDGKWLTHFPPGFPIALALASLVTRDPLVAARYLNAALFGVNCCLIGSLVLSATKSMWWALFASLVAVASTSLLLMHGNVWSEPLFIALVLTALARLQRGANLSAAALLGLATVTRYAGLGLIFGAAIVLFVTLQSETPQAAHRIKTTLQFLLIALALPLAVMCVNLVVGGSATNRSVGFHSEDLLDRSLMGVHELGTAMLPQATPIPIKILAVGLVCVLTAWLLRDAAWFARSAGLLLLAHVAFSYCTLVFADRYMALDGRQLSPALCLGLVAACCGIAGKWPSRTAIAVAAILTIAAALGVFRTTRLLVAPGRTRLAWSVHITP